MSSTNIICSALTSFLNSRLNSQCLRNVSKFLTLLPNCFSLSLQKKKKKKDNSRPKIWELFKFLFIIVDLQCPVNFCWAAKGPGYTLLYILGFPSRSIHQQIPVALPFGCAPDKTISHQLKLLPHEPHTISCKNSYPVSLPSLVSLAAHSPDSSKSDHSSLLFGISLADSHSIRSRSPYHAPPSFAPTHLSGLHSCPTLLLLICSSPSGFLAALQIGRAPSYLRVFVFGFCLFRAAHVAHGGSVPKARGPVRALAPGLSRSHSNTRSKLPLRPTPQLMAMPDP